MEFMDVIMQRWQQLVSTLKPFFRKAGYFFSNMTYFFEKAFRGIFRIRKILAAIPVVVLSIYLLIYNEANLPPVVGINLLDDGSFGIQIAREIAVFTPPLLTGLCLLLMFASRRILTPWLVSMFSLIIPLVILVTNVFPA